MVHGKPIMKTLSGLIQNKVSDYSFKNTFCFFFRIQFYNKKKNTHIERYS